MRRRMLGEYRAKLKRHTNQSLRNPKHKNQNNTSCSG